MSVAAEKVHEDYFGRHHRTLIRPSSGWKALDLRELWAYRELLWVFTVRDVKVRYKQTVLGAAWAVIQPVMLMVVFSVVFGKLGKIPSDGIPYPVFTYAALLPWTFFANSLGGSAGALIGASHLVGKVYFPRLIIPISSVGAWMIDFLVAAVILLGLMVYYGIGWSWNLLAAPLLMIGVLVSALGTGILLSAFTVTYRDFRHVIGYMIQFWMFATPVAYPASLVPVEWRWALYLNPMTGFVEGFRSAFLGRPFDVAALAIASAVAILVFFAGVAYFEKVERRFADII